VSEEQVSKPDHRSRPTSPAFREFIVSGWAPRSEALPEQAAVAPYAAQRRATLSARFPGERLVIPAGGLKVRSNDTDYEFRPHSAFAYLTGLGADREPDAVLVMEPRPEEDGGGHEARLYFMPLGPREGEEFFADSRYGEFWVGARPTLEAMHAELDLATAHISELDAALSKDLGVVALRVVRDADPQVTGLVDTARATVATSGDQAAEADTAQVEADAELARYLSTVRMVKDAWEADQLRSACAGTAVAFEGVVRQFPEAVRRGRGERWIEGVFGLHARHHGNGVGYASICAAGDHANTLHWIKNTGDLRESELVLIDAGIEVDSLYTADITRTLPVSGRFSDIQRRVYDAVYAAQSAGIAACRPGNTFKDVHSAAIEVIARTLFDWGLLPEGVDVERTLDAEHGQWHRRWMVHGTSHHLGLDVHDCQLALREDYLEGTLAPGMVITVEPGLYFKADDLLVPQELRGIGVRIEDDVLITDTGAEVLSAALPRSSLDVEAWMAGLLAP
jgi:Xaa-Pro aminopeptidase